MSTTATIRVSRDRARRSKDRTRAYGILVDDYEVGRLARGQSAAFAVTGGEHRVRAAVELDYSREWVVSLLGGDDVELVCRSRRKRAGEDYLDIRPVDPDDPRARPQDASETGDRDYGQRQRVLTRDGRMLTVWAHKSGYSRSLDPGGGGDPDTILIELALYVLVAPIVCLLRWARHRFVFRRGWSVAVFSKRRFLWARKLRLERFRSETDAKVRAAALFEELGSGPRWAASSEPRPDHSAKADHT